MFVMFYVEFSFPFGVYVGTLNLNLIAPIKVSLNFFSAMSGRDHHVRSNMTNEPSHEKINNLGFRASQTQTARTGQYRHRSRLEA